MNGRLRVRGATIALACAMGAVGAQPAPAQLGDVTEVVSSPECNVSMGGRIAVANAAGATFGGSASTRRGDLGHLVHIHHGAVAEFRFTTIEVASVTCIEDGRYATLTGTGRVDSSDGTDEIVGFRLEVQDTNDGRVADGYHLTLTNGYDTGLQPVLHGEIQVHFG